MVQMIFLYKWNLSEPASLQSVVRFYFGSDLIPLLVSVGKACCVTKRVVRLIILNNYRADVLLIPLCADHEHISTTARVWVRPICALFCPFHSIRNHLMFLCGSINSFLCYPMASSHGFWPNAKTTRNFVFYRKSTNVCVY